MTLSQTKVSSEVVLENILLGAMFTLFAALTFSTALVEISFGVAALTWAYLKLKHRNLSDLWSQIPGMLFLAGYLTIVIVTAVWSENYALSFKGILKVLQQTMILILAFDTFKSKVNFRRFAYFLVGLSAVVAFNGFFQYFFGQDLIRGFKGAAASSGIRVTGSFKSYGLLAAFLVMTLPWLVAVFWNFKVNKEKMGWKFLTIACFLGCATLLFLTRSRGPILAMGIVTFVLLVANRRLLILSVLGALGVVALLVTPREMVIHLDNKGKEQSIVERSHLWERAMNVIKAKPITGTGINTYAESHAAYDSRQSWRVRRYYAHNGYLQLAAETGLISLFFYLGFLFAVFRSGLGLLFRRDRYPAIHWIAAGMAGLLNFSVLAIVDTVMHNPLPVMTFWYLLGVYIALPTVYRGKLPPKEESIEKEVPVTV